MIAEARTLTLPVGTAVRRQNPPRDRWTILVLILVAGYLSMGRSFSYLGFPWLSLYIGEISLAAFLFLGPRTNRGRWLGIVRRTKRLRRVGQLLLLSLCYGAFEALRGALSGYSVFTALRDTAFNYYPLFLFLGVWAGLQDKDFLRRIIRPFAWWNGCYGVVFVLFLSHLTWKMPGTAGAASPVPLFSGPYGSAIALLGLLSMEADLKRVWHLLALNGFVLFGMQVRAEWMGFAVGLILFAWCTRRIKQAILAGGCLLVLVGVFYVVGLSLPAAAKRGGKISIAYVAARVIAPIDANLASELAPESNVRSFAGTATWRLVWWAAIWTRVNSDARSALIGFGYGYPVGSLNPLIAPGQFIQTPHNDFFYALAYSGWFGVAIFVLLQAFLLRLLLRG